MKNCLLLILFVLLLTGCAIKEDPAPVLTIEGYVKDEKNQQPVKDVNIVVEGVSKGLFGFRKKMGECISDQNGYFKMQFNAFEDAHRYDLQANKFSEIYTHISNDISIDAEPLHTSHAQNISVPLKPAASLQITFRNVTPVNDSDWFYYSGYTDDRIGFKTISDTVYGSVTSESGMIWLGKDVHASRILQTEADEYTYIHWEVEKNHIREKFKDSVYCPRDKETVFKINY